MKRLLATIVLALGAVLAGGIAGCAGHHHDEDPTAETPGGKYTCPRHGGSYDSAEDHCKVCREHVQRK